MDRRPHDAGSDPAHAGVTPDVPAHDGPMHEGPVHEGPMHLGRPLSRRERREAEDARARGGAPRRFPRLRRWLQRWVAHPVAVFLDALGNAF